jgi:cytochrome c5
MHQGQAGYFQVAQQGRQGMPQQGMNASVQQDELGFKLSTASPQVF